MTPDQIKEDRRVISDYQKDTFGLKISAYAAIAFCRWPDALDEVELLRSALFLVAEHDCFVTGDNDGVAEITPRVHTDGKIRLHINCGDTFAYACADGQEIPKPDFVELLSIGRKEGYGGLLRWVQKQRGGQDFIPPVKQKLETVKQLRAENERLKKRNHGLAKSAVKSVDVIAGLRDEIDRLAELDYKPIPPRKSRGIQID